MKLDKPRIVFGVSQDITLCSNMCQLVLLKHLCLDKRFQSVNFTVRLALHKFYFTESTLADDFDGLEVLWRFLSTNEAKESCFLLRQIVRFAGFDNVRDIWVFEDGIQLFCTTISVAGPLDVLLEEAVYQLFGSCTSL